MTDVATPPKPIRLTPQQAVALARMEQLINFIDLTAATTQDVTSVAQALTSASESLKAAHERYVASLQSTVSIAAPSDIAKLMQT